MLCDAVRGTGPPTKPWTEEYLYKREQDSETIAQFSRSARERKKKVFNCLRVFFGQVRASRRTYILPWMSARI